VEELLPAAEDSAETAGAFDLFWIGSRSPSGEKGEIAIESAIPVLVAYGLGPTNGCEHIPIKVCMKYRECTWWEAAWGRYSSFEECVFESQSLTLYALDRELSVTSGVHKARVDFVSGGQLKRWWTEKWALHTRPRQIPREIDGNHLPPNILAAFAGAMEGEVDALGYGPFRTTELHKESELEILHTHKREHVVEGDFPLGIRPRMEDDANLTVWKTVSKGVEI
jgi:hypothetical protein